MWQKRLQSFKVKQGVLRIGCLCYQCFWGGVRDLISDCLNLAFCTWMSGSGWSAPASLLSQYLFFWKGCLKRVQPSTPGQSYCRFLMAMSTQILDFSKNAHFINSLGNLFYCLSMLTTIKLFLVIKGIFFCISLLLIFPLEYSWLHVL